MRRRLSLIAIIALVIFALLLWAPWINGSYAKERAVAEFERAWLNVADGCGFACHGCGAAAWIGTYAVTNRTCRITTTTGR